MFRRITKATSQTKRLADAEDGTDMCQPKKIAASAGCTAMTIEFVVPATKKTERRNELMSSNILGVIVVEASGEKKGSN